MSHDTYEEITEKPWSSAETTLEQILAEIREELGEGAVIDLDRDVATTASCSCGEHAELFVPVHKLRGKDLVCPKCGQQMTFESVHTLCGKEDFLKRTPKEIGIPPLHIIAGRCGMEMRYYEFTKDADDVFLGL